LRPIKLYKRWYGEFSSYPSRFLSFLLKVLLNAVDLPWRGRMRHIKLVDR
jgi:hypothetical protein